MNVPVIRWFPNLHLQRARRGCRWVVGQRSVSLKYHPPASKDRKNLICIRLATGACQAGHNQANLGPTEPCTGCDGMQQDPTQFWM